VQFVQLLISGVSQGCIYGLIALGFVLIYKATETVSFAQGELMMLGAFCGLALMTVLGFPFWVAVLASVVAMGLFGVLVERAVIRPILGQPAFSIVMLTIGIGYVLRGLVTMIPNIGTDTHTLPVPYKDQSLRLGELVVSAEQLVVIGATGVLCVLMARHLHWPPARVQTLLKAALTMNLSILELQGQMAAQDVPMRERQHTEIHNHPEDAVATLQKWGVSDDDWLQAVAQHHEHPDGTGYPQGCTDMGELALALRVCDVFMAKISPRVLRPAVAPQEAVRQLYREDHGGPLSTAIIKEFGIYPPGDFVKLASGELGVVVQRTDNARAPIVASITDTSGHPVARTLKHDTSQAEFAIVGTAGHPAMLARLPPERLYGFAKVQTG